MKHVTRKRLVVTDAYGCQSFQCTAPFIARLEQGLSAFVVLLGVHESSCDGNRLILVYYYQVKAQNSHPHQALLW